MPTPQKGRERQGGLITRKKGVAKVTPFLPTSPATQSKKKTAIQIKTWQLVVKEFKGSIERSEIHLRYSTLPIALMPIRF